MSKLTAFMMLAVLACTASAQPAAGSAEVHPGKPVWDKWCSHCHAPGPRKHPGTSALQFVYKGEKPAALEERLDLTPELVKLYVRNGVNFMPFFRKTEISDKELAELAGYLSNH